MRCTGLLSVLLVSGVAVPTQDPPPAPAGQNPVQTPAPAQPAKPEAPKPDAVKQDPAKQDPAKQDPAKQDPAKPDAAKQDPAKPDASKDAAKAPVSKEKLEQLVAPIALYADPLLTQVLMASTYPLEVVQAARWQQKNATLKGEELEKALKDKDWEASVKALCGLPAVLGRMNDNLEWTQDLGDAFLADQAALMDAVQNMRRKAFESGNLKTTNEQKVEERTDKIIVIESANPEVVYVPTYYPTAVYGTWAYPTYYYPAMYPPYRPVYPAFTFAVGVAWGAAMFGGCSWGWGHSDVNINVNKQNNFNNRTNNINRPSNKPAGAGGKWQHDASHRKGVGYSNPGVANKYGGAGGAGQRGSQARGYGPSAGQQPARSGAGAGNAGGAGNRPSNPSASNRASSPGAGNRASNPSTATRPATSGQKSGGFSGAGSAQSTKAASSRGNTSRASSSGSRGGGGGASRGGGGRGGGGRGR